MATRLSLFAATGACLAALGLAGGGTTSAVLPSPGCSKKAVEQSHQDDLLQREIEVADFEFVSRSFLVQLPQTIENRPASASGPAPLLFSFHGQTGTAEEFATDHKFNRIGAAQGLITVFPQGMDDAKGKDDQGTTWNPGSPGKAGNATCVPEGVGDSNGCYESCRKLGRCGRCNWATCYDDVLFVKTLLKNVTEEFCIDLNRLYLHGESNGGMMVNHVVREMPDTWAGVSPWFGSPLTGFLLGRQMQLLRQQEAISKTSLLTLHARNDTTIPPGGGVSDSGWIYESEYSVRNAWAAIHGCKQEHTPLPTKWDGGNLSFSCHEHVACSSGRRVIGCRYNGVHGDWPTDTGGDEITLWFLLQFSRGQPTGRTEQLVV